MDDDDLALWIPCRPAEKKGIENEPLHVPLIAKDGCNDSRWECRHCGRRFFRRKPARMHMGLVMNTTHSCTVLAAQDAKRRERTE